MENNEAIEWEAYEYTLKKRGGEWYVAVSVVTLALAVTAILFNNVLLAILIIVGVFALMLYTARPPQLLHIRITARGIMVDKTLYPFGTLDSFWITDDEKNPKMLIKSKKTLMPLLALPITESIDPDDLADILIEFLPEVEQEESLSEHLADRLGF